MLTFFVTYRICERLQASDRDVLEQGIRTGFIVRRPDGTYLQCGNHCAVGAATGGS
jgi:hypothetical protein